MTNELTVESFKLSDQGLKKRNNEDWIDLHEPDDPAELKSGGRLYVVADGVGGAAKGERASKYAAQKVLYDFYRLTEPDLGERLRQTVQAANADIYEHTERTESQSPMGTTLVAAALREQELVVANVGDSRAYLIQGGQIRQLTRDHSLVQRLLDEDEITPEEAAGFRRKNVILRSVGADQDVEVDIFRYEVKAGDTLLLCTDGLHKYFQDPNELALLAVGGAPEQAARRLVSLANERGGSDNISVIIVRLLDPKLMPRRASAAPASRSAGTAHLDDKPAASKTTRPARRLRIGGRPVSPWMIVLLLAGVGALAVLLVALGLVVGTQIFGPIPLTSTETPLGVTVSSTPAPPGEPQPTTITSPAITSPAFTEVLPNTAISPTDTPIPTPLATASVTASPPTPVICKWVVEAGESVWSIAEASIDKDENIVERRNARIEEIARLNGLAKDPAGNIFLAIGRELSIPWSNPSSAPCARP